LKYRKLSLSCKIKDTVITSVLSPAKVDLAIQIASRLSEVDAAAWDALSAGRPFASYNWYRFGERVMTGCVPFYIIVSLGGLPVGRATFWQIADEPLPILALLRRPVSALLHRWPLLICRSPLSNSSGLILPDPPLREVVQAAIINTMEELARQTHCSFIIFDFLSEEQCSGWPENFLRSSAFSPGTMMDVKWDSFKEYLAGNHKVRRHYQYMQNKARELGLQVKLHPRVDRMDEAMKLIRRVEKHFDSAPNPWIEGMMEQLSMVNGMWVAATVDGQLVGCNIILEDGSACMNTGLGHNDLSYVYLIMMYENLRTAFDHHMRLLRWGSGAFEFKQRLGFELEKNNNLMFTSTGLGSLLMRRTEAIS
jgi:hypothetical protein